MHLLIKYFHVLSLKKIINVSLVSYIVSLVSYYSLKINKNILDIQKTLAK